MQNNGTNTVCSLCLKSSDHDFEGVGTGTREMLLYLGLKMELDVTENFVTCRDCSGNIQKCFEFKNICMDTEDCIISFRDNKNNAIKLDMGDIYLSKNGNQTDLDFPKNHTVCRLCMKIKDIVYCKTLSDKEKEILGTYFPKIDLDIIETPTICTLCYSSLYSYSSFMKNYLDVTETTGNCDFDSKNQGESILLLLLTYKGDPIKYYGNNKLYNRSEHESLLKIETQEMHIKHEVEHEKGDESEVDKLNSAPQFTTRNILCPENSYTETTVVKNDEHFKTEPKCENLIEIEKDEVNIKYEETKIKIRDSDIVRFRSSGLSPQSKLTKQLTNKETARAAYRCEICSYTTYYKHRLFRHNLIHQSSSEVISYQCDICTFKTIHKHVLKTHLLLHKNAPEHQCEECSYKTKFKRYMTKHKQIHINTSLMYSCDLCAYKTTQKRYLTKHAATHKNASDVTLYLCKMCKYKTKDKNSLKRHLLIHKDTSEVVMYKCEFCTFETRHKNASKCHLMHHRDISEITIYSCKMCPYKTKQKANLNRHVSIHKNASEIIACQCENCTFEKHAVLHEFAPETEVHLCKECDYKTKCKLDISKHMLTHKNAIQVYYCALCAYKAKQKGNLRRHMLVHKHSA